ncbi:MAG TPA: SGNH/GDSL hydrolase family protein [Polyangiaceae bacterium]
MKSLGFVVLACAAACAGHPEAVATAPTQAPAAAAPSVDAQDAGLATADVDAGAPAPAPAPAPRPAPRIILHAGDSMVGGNGGLAQALDARFKPLGSKYVRDWRVATVQTFDYRNYFGALLEKHHPDMVILCLGANDVFVPSPKVLARFVTSIARKASANGRPCYWITPPLWKPPDTGIVEVIKQNATGCKVFDSSNLKLPRWNDGIHPTNQGGVLWAEKFWAFYQADAEAEAPGVVPR